MTISRTFLTPVQQATVAVSCLMAMSMTARAQEKPKTPAAEELQEVVVTGSRIARPDLDRLEPTMIVSSGTFDERGYLDVGQALSENPAFGVQPSSAANTQSAFGIAQSFVDLYGLGSQRTLTLVNGRRFVSSNTASLNTSGSNSSVGGPGQQVDLNTIPTKLIDRVETISVGGAPIYGADAIAGTVNIILKKDFQGLDVDAQAGVSDRADAWNYRARVLGGKNFADDRGNITAVGEITKSDGLTGSARNVYSQDLQFESPLVPGKYQSVLTSGATVAGINYGGIPMVDDGVVYSPTGLGLPASPTGTYGVTNGNGQLLAWAKSSNLSPYSLGAATGNPVFSSNGDGERLSQVSTLLSPSERVNIDLLGNFKINDHVNAFTEGWFSESHATDLLQQPAYNTVLFGGAGTANGNFIVNINNPFLSIGDRTLIQTSLNNYAAALGGTGYLYPGWNAESILRRPRQCRPAERQSDRDPGAGARRGRPQWRLFRVGSSLQLGSGGQLWQFQQHVGSTRLRVSKPAERAERHLDPDRPDRVRGHSGERSHFDGIEHLRAAEHLREGFTESGRDSVHHASGDRDVRQLAARCDGQHRRRSVQAAGR